MHCLLEFGKATPTKDIGQRVFPLCLNILLLLIFLTKYISFRAADFIPRKISSFVGVPKS